MSKILVVGGAGGVGSCVVAALVQAGHAVSATVLDAGQIEQVKDRHGDAVAVDIVDFADADGARGDLDRIVRGRELDGVVVCAAIAPDNRPVELTPLSTFRSAFEINTLANIAVFQATLPTLRLTGGRIVFITSPMGRVAMPVMGAYATSKFALEGVADVMRREAAHQGVKVLLVAPGAIRTPMLLDKLAIMQALHDEMSAEDQARYGHLMKALQAQAANGSGAGGQTGEQVAQVVLAALTDDDPEPRLLVGDGAELYRLAKGLPDRELDGMLAQAFSPAASTART